MTAREAALSLLLRGMARKLVAYRKWMSGDDVPVVHRLRREAEERQARIDRAMVEIAAWWGTAQRGDRVLMAVKSILSDLNLSALVGEQPTAVEEADDAAGDLP